MYSVILVEDEEIIRRGIRCSISWEKFGCQVVGEAGNGVEGEKLIEELNPDIVIADINMPIIDGLEMISETKTKYDYVAIILTGYSEFEYAKKAIQNGVLGYVLKPLNMDEMEDILEQAVLECRNNYYLRQKNKDIQEMASISLLKNKKDYRDPFVDQVLEYLEENYQKKITFADLKQKFHYSERYISQRFQKAVGTTVIEYLNRYRIQKALDLIKNGELPISEIGWKCGIGEYKYFNYVFKKYIGCSVKEYQNKIR